jgi:hypothetical protein
VGQVSIAGTVLGGPVQVGAGFPQAIFTTTLGTTPSPKPFSAATGVLQRRVNVAAPAFAVLSGVGVDDTVTKGDLLYFRTDPLNPSGPPLIRELFVNGLAVIEFPAASPLILLEAQGSATIEYAITGQ